jgi:hypothetical protein
MEEEFYGASGTDPRSIAGMGVLNSLSGGRGDLVQQYVNEAVPLPKKADPYVAALKFFIEMGKQASQPGATVLGSITGSMGAPVDYLEAKALERQKAEQARSALGLQIAPSLKPPAATKAGYTNVTVDGIAQVMTPTEIQAAKAAGKVVAPYEKPSETSYTFKERKFYKTGLPAAVVKNETRMAAGNPVYPLSATGSALNIPDKRLEPRKPRFVQKWHNSSICLIAGPVVYQSDGKVVRLEEDITDNLLNR